MRTPAKVALLCASSMTLFACSEAGSGSTSSTSPDASGILGSGGFGSGGIRGSGSGATSEGGSATGGAFTASGGSPGNGGTVATGNGGSLGGGGAQGSGGAANGGSNDGGGAGGAGGNAVPLVGVYCGNVVADVQTFESWLARPVDGILGYTGQASWTDYDGSVGWATGVWGAIDRHVFWSVPLIPTGATLADAAAGMYDDHYKKAAKTLAAFRPQDAKLNIRTGWEFNGNWFPWAAAGKAADFVGAYQHFVTAFRSASNRFVFEWNVNMGGADMNPADAYPGDGYVDIIGMDFYWNTQWDPTDPVQAWDKMVNQTYGLKWHQDFAAAHGKPTSYSEWGIMSDNAAYYIQHAQTWFESHHVVFHTYWNSNSAFQGKLSDGQYPNAGAAYKTAFGP